MKRITAKVQPRPEKRGSSLWARIYDPNTGKRSWRKLGTRDQKQAEREAARLEDELNAKAPRSDGKMGWEAFVEVVTETRLPNVAPRTAAEYLGALKKFCELTSPQRAADLDTHHVDAFTREYRKSASIETVRKHLRSLKAIANWAVKHEYLPSPPVFDMPKSEKTMKGGALTGEQFGTMLDAVDSLYQGEAAKRLQFLLEGLWVTGIRIEDAVNLRWERRPKKLWLELKGEESLLGIDKQKSKKSEKIPLAPEAVELFTPVAEESGYVFELLGKRGNPIARDANGWSKRVVEVGKASGVKVSETKHASSHDLRRSFGTRWSTALAPADLRRIMRHDDIKTTLNFYVDADATATCATLWKCFPKVREAFLDSRWTPGKGGD